MFLVVFLGGAALGTLALALMGLLLAAAVVAQHFSVAVSARFVITLPIGATGANAPTAGAARGRIAALSC